MTDAPVKPIEYGDRFTFEQDGHEPREYVLVDPAELDDATRWNYGARVRWDNVDFAIQNDEQILLQNVKTAGFAAIRGHWLLGIRSFPGRWVPVP